ncbi:MAG: UMP kinase [Candidatus Micrarchaeota archaeon]|nr:UMP kinase [Candidatus Micrarchaeota archaeon]
MDKIICVSLGGSGVTDSSGIDQKRVKKFIRVLQKNKKYRFIVVVGGGKPARMYINSLRHKGASDEFLDSVGIMVTRLNAFAVKGFAPRSLKVYPKVAKSLEEAKGAIKRSRVVFMGGLHPGITTDGVTALVCKAVGSKLLINLSSEPYVYDKNPELKGAKKFETLTYDQLLELSRKYGQPEPGLNFIFDITASRIVKRSKIEVRFAGYSAQSFADAITGKHKGTTVK